MLDRLHEVFEDLLEKWECRVIEFNLGKSISINL
ncbi:MULTISPECIES: hypothetical protein [unclassified Desertifilum]|uniref:Uncharacterized protein n=1 Tax=Desertifilum tharense IPPAS B-1220 TaxID=1781255 RepID=A0ACD5GXN0_9CYAN|nr:MULTISPECIES: hypothetical protein [unclassified Desertifilum]